jgi:hypothetical protein
MPRLSSDMQADLRWFWNDCEAALGIRSAGSAALEAIEDGFAPRKGGRYGGSRRPDPMPDYQEPARRRALTIRRALGAVDELDGGGFMVLVLYRVYGPRVPLADLASFGEVAPIVKYTDAWSKDRSSASAIEKEAKKYLRKAEEAYERAYSKEVASDRKKRAERCKAWL